MPSDRTIIVSDDVEEVVETVDSEEAAAEALFDDDGDDDTSAKPKAPVTTTPTQVRASVSRVTATDISESTVMDEGDSDMVVVEVSQKPADPPKSDGISTQLAKYDNLDDLLNSSPPPGTVDHDLENPFASRKRSSEGAPEASQAKRVKSDSLDKRVMPTCGSTFSAVLDSDGDVEDVFGFDKENVKPITQDTQITKNTQNESSSGPLGADYTIPSPLNSPVRPQAKPTLESDEDTQPDEFDDTIEEVLADGPWEAQYFSSEPAMATPAERNNTAAATPTKRNTIASRPVAKKMSSVPANGTRTKTCNAVNKEAEKQRKQEEKQRRQEEKQRKQEEKERRKREAQLEKEQRKQLDSANKVTRNKQETSKEMIVDMCDILYGQELGESLTSGLRQAGVEVRKWDKGASNWHPIRLKRKVTSKYDPEEDIYRPCDPETKVEDRALVFIQAQDFANIVENDKLTEHTKEIRRVFVNQSIVYVIQGLDLLVRKVENAKSRAYTERVRQLMGDEANDNAKRKRATNTSGLDRAKAEQLLVTLQIDMGFNIIQTNNTPETVNWMVDLIEVVGQAPYKTTKLLGDEVVDVGVIPSGKDMLDTFTKSLQQLKFVTPAVAQTVTSIYPDVSSLMNKLVTSGDNAISGIKKTAANGSKRAAANRTVASTIHTVFTSRDPDKYLEDME